jgi:hypothetical protein
MIINPNSYGKVIFLEDGDMDGFEEQKKHVLTQIDAFEELLKEIDDDSE